MNVKLFIKQAAGTLVFFAVIFFSAGKFLYWPGIIYVVLGLVMLILSYTVLLPDRELLEERSKVHSDSKKWDKNILLLSFVATIAMYATAGFDSGRFHWSPGFHPALTATGVFLTAAGQFLFLLAQKQNRFFSSTVRIQYERDHTVCDSGLYRFVRHPAYMGNLIQYLGFPLLFGSVWSCIPVAFSVILLLIRTRLEDRTLLAELTGYRIYADRVGYRIVPFVW